MNGKAGEVESSGSQSNPMNSDDQLDMAALETGSFSPVSGGKESEPDPRDWLAAIIAGSDDAIISKDLAGSIRSWNAGAARLFGYTAEETISRPITILIPEDRLDEEPRIRGRNKSSSKSYAKVERSRNVMRHAVAQPGGEAI